MTLRELIKELHPEDVNGLDGVPDSILGALYPKISSWSLDYHRISRVAESGMKIWEQISTADRATAKALANQIGELYDSLPSSIENNLPFRFLDDLLSESVPKTKSNELITSLDRFFLLEEEEDELTDEYFFEKFNIHYIATFLAFVYSIDVTSGVVGVLDAKLWNSFLALGDKFNALADSFTLNFKGGGKYEFADADN